MKMKRKGFLAALLGLAAAPVLGKAESKFPRWFVWNPPGPSTDALNDVFRVNAENLVYGLSRVGRKPKRLHHHKPLNRRDANGHLLQVYDDGPTTLSDMLEGVARGFFCEITAAEAEALLKQAYRLRHPKGQHVNSIICDDEEDAGTVAIWRGTRGVKP